MEEGRQNRMDHQLFRAASNGDLQFFENFIDLNTLLQVTIEKNTILHVAVQFNQLEAARKIVHLNSRLAYEANSKGNTPLHIAARKGSSSMVELLIELEKEQEQDIERGRQHQLLRKVNRDGDTALHVAAQNCNFQAVRELVNEDPELAKHENKAGESALFIAVNRECYRTAFFILDAAPEYCSYAGRHRMNVLHAIVIRTDINNAATGVMENLKLFAFLFKGTWEPMDLHRAQTPRGGHPTPGAMESSKKNIIEKLKLFASFFKRTWEVMDYYGEGRQTGGLYTRMIRTEFFKAVMEKCPSTINQEDVSGWTPLHMAAHMGNREFVKLLLENDNSSAYLKNKASLSALHIAAKKGNVYVMKELTTACPDIYELLNESYQSALHVAAESGEKAAVEFFLERPEFNGLINEQDIDGNTPMHLAAINGHYRIVSLMARCGNVNPNAMNIKGSTPMDIVLSGKLDFQLKEALRMEGARPSLMGLLKKAEKADNSKSESADTETEAVELRDEGMTDSNSDFMKQRSDSTLVVATLIATVTFTAAFTVPGGYKSQDGVDEGSAVLSKRTSFQIFLIANSAAFGLSLASVFSHFTASNLILDFIQRKKFVARAPDSTSISTFAMLLAFILGTYTVVPHNMGITIAVIVCWCFFGSYIISLLHILKSSLSLLVSSSIQKQKEEVKKKYSPNKKQNKEELKKNHSTIQKQNKEEVKKNYNTTSRSDSGMSTLAPATTTS